ncbi:hypothetical protein U9M48_001175 [Paspalum notatum var. saurae]|uniref:Uncharacterized protein n=1 Tax=Paspalum notatum var. saurae TaxID=547442 RepID=A0AAQ3PMY9_PASNO
MAGPSSHESISRAVSLKDLTENITTSEAMRRLISYYQHSQYYMNAQQKVDEMARLPSSSAALENCRYCCCEQASSGDSTVANDELPKISGDYILEKVF